MGDLARLIACPIRRVTLKRATQKDGDDVTPKLWLWPFVPNTVPCFIHVTYL